MAETNPMHPDEYKIVERRLAPELARRLVSHTTQQQRDALMEADRKVNIALNERRDLTAEIVDAVLRNGR